MLWLIARLYFDVRLATLVGASLAGQSELGPVLVQIARRESNLRLIGVHDVDSKHAAAVRPQECPHDQVHSTRGSHGQFAVFALQYAPSFLRCSPWLLDVPIASAYLAAKRAASRRCRSSSRCRSWLRA